MNASQQIEKFNRNKARKDWNEEITKKGDKRNKTKRDRSTKRHWNG